MLMLMYTSRQLKMKGEPQTEFIRRLRSRRGEAGGAQTKLWGVGDQSDRGLQSP